MADKDKTYIDPVCGMEVNKDTAAGHSRHDGVTYYFCAVECKERFDLNPAEYTTSIVPKD